MRSLPIKLEAELHGPRRIGCGDRPKIAVAQVGIWLEEIGMIQRVEHLEAELQSRGFPGIPPLLYSHVPIEVTGGTEVR